MDLLKAERRARSWLIVSAIVFAISAFIAPRTSGPWPWLVPFAVSFNVILWFQIWRSRRAERLARASEMA